MIEVRTADRRYQGGDPEAGITSRHAFSFGPHYDPDNLRFGPMTACNEERLAPGAGFDEHPHRDTEIVTCVIEGQLTHRDTLTGEERLVRAGDVALLSAARGVRHVERNAGEEPCRFVQTWLVPREAGGEPSYEILPLGSRDLPEASVPVPGAGAVLHLWTAHGGTGAREWRLPDAPLVYVHVVHGSVDLEGTVLRAGDAARVSGEPGPRLTAAEPARCLVWELEPARPREP